MFVCPLPKIPGIVNFNRSKFQSNSIELSRTQSVDWVRLSSAIERNRTHRKEKKSIEPNRTFDFRTRDLCKTDVENPLPDLRSSSYFSPECSARVFRKRRNSAEMASDALWIVSFKCIVKGYQECRFDVKDGEVFRVLKKIGEKGRAFRIANERGQLGHLQRELVASLRTKCTRTSDHLLWFWPKEKDNFIVAFTISPFYHGSKMLPNIQYTEARTHLLLSCSLLMNLRESCISLLRYFS